MESKLSSRTYLLDAPYEHNIKEGEVFRFFGHVYTDIQYIAEDFSLGRKRFRWQTRDSKEHEFQFSTEKNYVDELTALLVALRIS